MTGVQTCALPISNTAKRKQLIERANSVMKGDERVLTQENYRSDLIGALNYYNSNHDDKQKKKWFITHHAKSDKKSAVEFLKLDEKHFRYAGILARLIDLGSELQENEQKRFEDEIEKLHSLTKKEKPVQVKVVETPTNVISIQQRMEEKAHELAGEIEEIGRAHV